MMGVIINSFIEFVNAKGSNAARKELETLVGNQQFLATQNYPDELVFDVISKVAAAEGKSADDILVEFGKFFVTVFASKNYATLFAMQPDAKSFLLSLDTVHQAASRSLSEEATPPTFDYEEEDTPNKLVMKYSSSRKLCSLVKGLIQGVAERYGETVSINETQCMKHGAPHCRIEIDFGA